MEKKEVGKGAYVNPNGDYGLFMGGFPRRLAQEWEKDCKDNYGGCRWAKAYTDHCKSRQLEVEQFVQNLPTVQQPEKQEEQEEVIKTLGKGE